MRGRDNDNRKKNSGYDCTDKYDTLRHIALMLSVTCYKTMDPHTENLSSSALMEMKNLKPMTAQVQNHITLAVAQLLYHAFLIWPDTRVIVQRTTLASVCDGNRAHCK